MAQETQALAPSDILEQHKAMVVAARQAVTDTKADVNEASKALIAARKEADDYRAKVIGEADERLKAARKKRDAAVETLAQVEGRKKRGPRKAKGQDAEPPAS